VNRTGGGGGTGRRDAFTVTFGAFALYCRIGGGGGGIGAKLLLARGIVFGTGDELKEFT
jgi:hypothetical protein